MLCVVARLSSNVWTDYGHQNTTSKSQPTHEIPIINNFETNSLFSLKLIWSTLHGSAPQFANVWVNEVFYVCRSSVTRNRYTHSSTTIFVSTVVVVIRTCNCNYPIWRFIKYLPVSIIIKIVRLFRTMFLLFKFASLRLVRCVCVTMGHYLGNRNLVTTSYCDCRLLNLIKIVCIIHKFNWVIKLSKYFQIH